MRRVLAWAVFAALVAVPVEALTAQVGSNWDGLVQTKDERAGSVYLLPGADFSKYTKVMIEKTEVAFAKDFQKGGPPVRNRISESTMRRVLDKASVEFGKSLEKAFTKRGIAVVQAPGTDVLRLRPAVVDLSFVIPNQSAGFSRTFAENSGQATMVLEARDSMAGTLLGRALDASLAGDDMIYRVNEASIYADFKRLFDDWSKRVVKGFDTLRAQPPVSASAQP